jgi:hypothetical protein
VLQISPTWGFNATTATAAPAPPPAPAPLPNAPLTEYQPWLANLSDPSKLTNDQKLACGLVPPWTCSAGDSKKRKKCHAMLGGEVEQRRRKCEQFSAVPPPPVMTGPVPATNPQASPGAGEAAYEQQHAALAQDVSDLTSQLAPADAAAVDPYAPPGDSFAPYAAVSRKRDPYTGQPIDDEPGLFDMIPTWAWLAAALAVGYAVTR